MDKVSFEFFVVRWTDNRGRGWYGENGGGCGESVEDAKRWKTKAWADKFVARFPTLPLEVVRFVATQV